jgi:hypothetical protein
MRYVSGSSFLTALNRNIEESNPTYVSSLRLNPRDRGGMADIYLRAGENRECSRRTGIFCSALH